MSNKLGKHLKAVNDREKADAHRLSLVNTDAIDFVPTGELVLAELVDMDRTAGGIVLPEAFADSSLRRWRVTDAGPDVTRVKVGDEFIVGNTVDSAKNGGVMYEVPGRTIKTRLVHQSIIIAIVRMPEPPAAASTDSAAGSA